MTNIEEAREALIKTLSEHYTQDRVSVEEYERILDYITKIETSKEAEILRKILQEYQGIEDGTSTPEKRLSLFSYRRGTVTSVRGKGGTYTCIFGMNQIIVDNLPKGITVLEVHSIFGLTEILIPQHIKIVNKAVPIFGGIFAPQDASSAESELHIIGEAVFGNITIKRTP
jgi:hypothetical protein